MADHNINGYMWLIAAIAGYWWIYVTGIDMDGYVVIGSYL